MVLGDKGTVGIDIGATGVRAVELTSKDGRPSVEGWGAVDFEAEVSDWGVADVAAITRAIRQLAEGRRFRGRLVAHSVSGQAVVPQYFNFPQLMPEDVEETVRIEVESSLPFRGEDALVSYILFPEQKTGSGKLRTHGITIAADGKFVEARLDVIRRAGLEPFCVEMDATACANAFLATRSMSEEDGTTAILNIGHSYTNLALLGGEGTLLVRDVPWGGMHLTATIAELLGTPREEAKRLKHLHWQKGPSEAEDLEKVLPQSFQESAQDLVARLRDTIHYWVSERLVSQLARVFLTGGGSQVRGLTEFLSDSLSVPVELWSPIRDTISSGMEAGQEPWEYRLTVAFGLALRKFARSGR